MNANVGIHLFCTYADDVRQEIGGKLTYVGVYQGGGLTVHGELPLLMPKLAIIASLFIPFDKEITSVKVFIKFNEELLLPEIDVPKEVVSALIDRANSHPDSAGAALQFIQVIQPLNIATPGALRCQAEVDGELIKGNALEIQVVPLAAE